MQSEKFKMITLHNEDTGDEDQYAMNSRPLGEGKTAKVYKATNWPDQTKLFAIKVIKITSQEVRKDYLKELKIIKNLPNCPNIVKTYKQHLQSENNLYIFQEYCQSGTLSTYKQQKLGIPLSEIEIYNLFYQTTNGLIFLLEAGIVHEDIKPANILKKGPIFKLCDFGVSEISKEYVESTTRKGTISYMPPQKLKVKNFVPSDKSDLFSLGVCLYEIFFGIHPYLTKKTSNYKEYLQALQGATLKPLPQLMKKIGSTSFKLENLFKFLERMIDLNEKTRATLTQLKDFLANNEPFKDMQPIDEESSEFKTCCKRISINQNQAQAYYQSVIKYRESEQQNNFMIYDAKPKVDKNAELKKQLAIKYDKESPYVMGVISLLVNSIDLMRKINFNCLNINPVQKNFFGIDLTDCKISRFIKYLIFQFSISVLKQFKKRYECYLEESKEEEISGNQEYLQKEFYKFLIECDFENKDLLAQQINNRQSSLTLGLEIAQYYQNFFNSLIIVEQNKKNVLLCILYCIYIPKILDKFKSLKSVFSNESLQQLQKFPLLGDTSFEDGCRLLEQINKAEKMKKDWLKDSVEKQFNKLEKEFIFDIAEDSQEIEVITEEDLI